MIYNLTRVVIDSVINTLPYGRVSAFIFNRIDIELIREMFSQNLKVIALKEGISIAPF